MIQKDTKKSPKNSDFFVCEFCDFTCCKRSEFDIHLSRPKHTNNMKRIQKDTKKLQQFTETIEEYICDCGNKYKHHSGLWRHKKNCKEMNMLHTATNVNQPIDKDLIMMLIKENSELKNIMIDQQNMILKVIENGSNNTITNSNNNSNNKSFNLNLFLNETCKDAMNIMDFVDSIQLQLSDLERVGEIGYVEGISNIITTNLKKLDITQRPVHCIDKKRETIYIKDENIWEKDAEQNKLRKAIKKVASKNQRLLPKFKELYPDCINSSSKYSDKYNKLIIEAMGGRGDNDCEKEEKIIKKISKTVLVEKEPL